MVWLCKPQKHSLLCAKQTFSHDLIQSGVFHNYRSSATLKQFVTKFHAASGLKVHLWHFDDARASPFQSTPLLTCIQLVVSNRMYSCQCGREVWHRSYSKSHFLFSPERTNNCILRKCSQCQSSRASVIIHQWSWEGRKFFSGAHCKDAKHSSQLTSMRS